MTFRRITLVPRDPLARAGNGVGAAVRLRRQRSPRVVRRTEGAVLTGPEPSNARALRGQHQAGARRKDRFHPSFRFTEERASRIGRIETAVAAEVDRDHGPQKLPLEEGQQRPVESRLVLGSRGGGDDIAGRVGLDLLRDAGAGVSGEVNSAEGHRGAGALRQRRAHADELRPVAEQARIRASAGARAVGARRVAGRLRTERSETAPGVDLDEGDVPPRRAAARRLIGRGSGDEEVDPRSAYRDAGRVVAGDELRR